jgi:8-hydroxy-5-deazaflavin:NADPH oxidoreductase
MAHVSIVGTDTMGQAIAGVVSRGGSTVELLGQGDADQPVTGEVVVDITNPVDFQTFDSLIVPADGSAAGEIAAALPQSRVVKAFNTTFAATLASGTVGAQPATVPIAGDDVEVASLLAGLVTAGGLRAVDAGSLRRARELEAPGFLQISLAAGEKLAWTGGFAVVA